MRNIYKIILITCISLHALTACAYDIKFLEKVSEVRFNPTDFIVVNDFNVKNSNTIVGCWQPMNGCKIKTPTFLTNTHNQIIEVEIDFEGSWRTSFDDVLEVNEQELVNITLQYNGPNGVSTNVYHLHPFHFGKIRAFARWDDAGDLIGKTESKRTFVVPPLSLPDGSSDVEIQIGDIQPKTSLKIHQIRVRMLTRAEE